MYIHNNSNNPNNPYMRVVSRPRSSMAAMVRSTAASTALSGATITYIYTYSY